MPKFSVFRIDNAAPYNGEHMGEWEAETAGDAERMAEAEFGKETCHMWADDDAFEIDPDEFGNLSGILPI